jgi:hypothetical protein
MNTISNPLNKSIMKTKLIKIKLLALLSLMLIGSVVMAQQPAMQYFRPNDKRGINVFETSKKDSTVFKDIQVRVGGDFAIQFQALNQTSELDAPSGVDTLQSLENNFNLPTANLNIDVQLADGVRLHMRTYLSSRHHNEGWVKGGYVQIDNLNFIKEGFLSGLMDFTTFRFGYNDINFGDQHFRRSDNGTVIYNPFVGNFIMDSFTTEPFGEITVQKSGILGVFGMTNGRLNQTTADPTSGPSSLPGDGDGGPALYLKLGYDKDFSEDFRFRLTGSYYKSSDKSTREYLYGGDRAGARYYEVLNRRGENNDFEPRVNPGFAYMSAIQINPFVKFKGLEFFGVYEVATNGDGDIGGKYTQTGGELLYRFGGKEQLYLGARGNFVNGYATDAAEDADQKREVARYNFALGWFMTDNIVIKMEYVTEERSGDGYLNSKYQGAKWDGIMLEAGISF